MSAIWSWTSLVRDCDGDEERALSALAGMRGYGEFDARAMTEARDSARRDERKARLRARNAESARRYRARRRERILSGGGQ